jgi:hypothetical protein
MWACWLGALRHTCTSGQHSLKPTKGSTGHVWKEEKLTIRLGNRFSTLRHPLHAETQCACLSLTTQASPIPQRRPRVGITARIS